MKKNIFPVALFLILLCIAAATKYVGSFSGDGSLLTGLNGTQITSGTVADARLSSNLPLKNGVNVFANNNDFTSSVQFDGGVVIGGGPSAITNALSVGTQSNPSTTNALEAWTMQYGVEALNVGTNGNTYVNGNLTVSGPGTNTTIAGNTATYNLTATNLVTAKQYAGTQVNISALNIDWSSGTHFWKIIAANTAFTFTNTNDTYQVVVAVTGDASHTVTWTGVKWTAGTAPTQTLSKTDIYTFVQINGTNYGSAVQNF
jgi:hypothetical protein